MVNEIRTHHTPTVSTNGGRSEASSHPLPPSPCKHPGPRRGIGLEDRSPVSAKTRRGLGGRPPAGRRAAASLCRRAGGGIARFTKDRPESDVTPSATSLLTTPYSFATAMCVLRWPWFPLRAAISHETPFKRSATLSKRGHPLGPRAHAPTCTDLHHRCARAYVAAQHGQPRR